MASPEAIGTAVCQCGEKVYVCKNKGGFAYYRCGCCGVEVRHHRHSASGKFVAEKVSLFQQEKQEPAPVVQPAAKPEPTPKPAKVQQKPAPGSVASFLGLGG